MARDCGICITYWLSALLLCLINSISLYWIFDCSCLFPTFLNLDYFCCHLFTFNTFSFILGKIMANAVVHENVVALET